MYVFSEITWDHWYGERVKPIYSTQNLFIPFPKFASLNSLFNL